MVYHKRLPPSLPSVVAVDSSAVAVAAAKRNAQLNGYHVVDDDSIAGGASVGQQIKFHTADCVDFMRQRNSNCTAGGRLQFDLVICDPPKLAPTRAGLARALTKYVGKCNFGIVISLIFIFDLTVTLTLAGDWCDYVCC